MLRVPCCVLSVEGFHVRLMAFLFRSKGCLYVLSLCGSIAEVGSGHVLGVDGWGKKEMVGKGKSNL